MNGMVKSLDLMKVSNGLLSILEPALDDKNIPLKDKDYVNIQSGREFLRSAITGWEEKSGYFLQCDNSLFASRISLESIANYISYVQNIEEIKIKLREYIITLDKFQKGEKIYKEEIKNITKFFDGLAKISEEEMQKNMFGVTSSRQSLNDLLKSFNINPFTIYFKSLPQSSHYSQALKNSALRKTKGKRCSISVKLKQEK